MKKLLALFVIMGMAVAANAIEVIPTVSYINMGNISATTATGTTNSETNPGWSVGCKVLGSVGSNFEVGGGIDILGPIKINNTSEQFNFIPIYAVGQYCFMPSSPLKPFVKASVGVNTTYNDNTFYGTSGNGYYGFGLGLRLHQKWIIEVQQNYYLGSMGATNINYNALQLKVGYAFCLKTCNE